MFNKQEISVLHTTRRKFLKTMQDNMKNLEYDHYTSRIKTNESIINKLYRKGLEHEPGPEDALKYLQDIIGVRIVTQYINDVYDIVECIKNNYEVIEEIDYIANPKESGYRSFHIVINFPIINNNFDFKYATEIPIEIQIRTMGMDFWASLEHSVIYDKKKNMPLKDIDEDNAVGLVNKELLRYAEDIFSIDMRIQALKHITEHAIKRSE